MSSCNGPECKHPDHNLTHVQGVTPEKIEHAVKQDIEKGATAPAEPEAYVSRYQQKLMKQWEKDHPGVPAPVIQEQGSTVWLNRKQRRMMAKQMARFDKAYPVSKADQNTAETNQKQVETAPNNTESAPNAMHSEPKQD